MKSKHALLLLLPLLSGCATKPPPAEPDLSWVHRRFERLEAHLTRLEQSQFDQLRSTHVWIRGQIQSPGFYAVPDGPAYTLSDLIDDAGGLTPLSAAFRVRLTRTRDGGAEAMFEMDIKPGDAAGKVSLQPGDIIYIPEVLGM